MVSTQTLDKLLNFLRKNNNPYSGVEKNYLSQISRETGINRQTLTDAIDWLEKQNMVERKRQGQKKIIIPKQTQEKQDQKEKPAQKPGKNWEHHSWA